MFRVRVNVRIRVRPRGRVNRIGKLIGVLSEVIELFGVYAINELAIHHVGGHGRIDVRVRVRVRVVERGIGVQRQGA